MRISILPKSSLGRWSVGLAAAFILLFVLFWILIAPARRGVGPAPFAPMAIVAAGISGIAAFVIGLISMIRSKERSILVFLAVVVGLFVLIFCLGEVIFPH